MDQFEDRGIVLHVRKHGENGAIVTLLTKNCGKHAGYVHAASSSAKRAVLEIGNEVHADWQARSSEQLGTYKLELIKAHSSAFMEDKKRLLAILSACALCFESLPEREQHPEAFHGLLALFQNLESEIWAATYIMWEIAFLRTLGFELDLSKCALTDTTENLAYVSPKTGRVVCAEAAAPYKEKLLPLPEFLKGRAADTEKSGTEDDIATGLALTSYFFEHWVFAQSSRGFPEPRLRFETQFAKNIEDVKDSTAN